MVEMAELLRKDAQEALEQLEMFTDSGFYTLDNNQVRIICHALRAFMKTDSMPLPDRPRER
jgi:hypothetical protein